LAVIWSPAVTAATPNATRIDGTSADYPTEKEYFTLAQAIYKHLG
jgi:hypothetical protein